MIFHFRSIPEKQRKGYFHGFAGLESDVFLRMREGIQKEGVKGDYLP